METKDIPEEDKDTIVNNEVVELSWYKRITRPMTEEELSHRRGRRPKSESSGTDSSALKSEPMYLSP